MIKELVIPKIQPNFTPKVHNYDVFDALLAYHGRYFQLDWLCLTKTYHQDIKIGVLGFFGEPQNR